jgi:ubiquinone/menaquinone biosynthesis C-methylase UbiE
MEGKGSGFQLMDAGPGAYERYMVPIHCEHRAMDLLDRVHLEPREHVLDVACGSGIVARHAARWVGDLGKVVGIELNPAMLDVARQVSAYTESVEYLQGDAAALPVSDASFDVVLCQHAIMFFPDREASVREMHRVLKPRGRVAVSVFRSADFNPAFKHLVTALERHGGPEAAEFMRSPFIMESVPQMRTLFEQAGFDDICVTNRIETLRYPSVAHLVRYETLNIADAALHTTETQEALIEEMSALVADYVDDHGVVFPAQDYVVVARR